MNKVTIAPRSHQLMTEFSVVSPNADLRFTFTADCPFRELRTIVSFVENDISPLYKGATEGFVPFTPDEAIHVRFIGRRGFA